MNNTSSCKFFLLVGNIKSNCQIIFDSSRKNKPFFVTVYVEPEEEVLPYVPGGKANIDAILHS